jgi:HEAT repeat protein
MAMELNEALSLEQLIAKKENLEKEKRVLLEKTFYNQQQPAVKTKAELDKRIQKFEAQQRQAGEDGEDFSPQKLAYLKLCKAALESLDNLDKEIAGIEKDIQEFERNKSHVQANIGVDELSASGKCTVHVGHEFYSAISNSNVEANTYVEKIAAPNSHLHVGPLTQVAVQNIYQAAPYFFPPINYKLVLQRLQKSLCARYQQYTHLERLFDNNKVPIADSFINLALIKEAEYKAKEQDLACGSLEEKSDGDARKKSGDYIDERMASHEELYAVKEPLLLTELFEPKNDTRTPNKILILGRAGIGKSILCQYLATQWAASDTAGFDNDNGADAKNEERQKVSISHYLRQKFDAVFWLKLREVGARATDRDTLLDVLDRFCLEGLKKDKPTRTELASYLEEHTDRILFILDGYDEITDRIDQSEYRYLNRILAEINAHQHLLLTSRPIMIDSLGDRPIRFDRRLENMGFLNENIKDYVHRFMQAAEKSEQVTPMLSFLKAHPSVWGIAHIPINLELLSWLWSKGKLNFEEGEIITLSKLYQTIIDRVQKSYIQKYSKRPAALALDGLMESKKETIQSNAVINCVNEFLEYLAYCAMKTEKLFIPSAQIKIALEKILTQHGHLNDEDHQEQLLKSATDKLGFLRSTGEDEKSQLDQEHYFIHFSFQEFYAARYILRIFSQHLHSEEGKQVFECILTEKYTPRYQLMLWMSAGLLYQQGKKSQYQQFSPLLRFWRAILSQPRDMIGFHHNILIIHCLDECEADDQITLHKMLIDQQCRWLTFYVEKDLADSYIEKLAQCRLTSAPIMTCLLQVLENSYGPLRKIAINVLSRLNVSGDFITEALLRALQDKNTDIRSAAIRALGNINNPSDIVIKSLLSALRDKEGSISSASTSALGKLSNLSNVVVAKLLSTLKDEDKYIRSLAAQALYGLKHHSEAVIESLLYALQDQEGNVRCAVISVLGNSNNPSDIVIRELLSALQDEDKYVRSAAIEALCNLKHIDKVVIEKLLNTLRDKEKTVRDTAASALGKLKNPSKAAIEVLLSLLEYKDVNFRSAAIAGLSNLDSLNETVMSKLLEALRDESSRVRCAAIYALGNLNNLNETIIKELLGALQNDSSIVKYAAISVLGNLNNLNESLIQMLINAFKNKDEHRDIRYAAISVLGNLNDLSQTIIEELFSFLEKWRCDYHEVAQMLSTPKTMQATIYIFSRLVRNEKISFEYFSCWFKKNYLLLIDHAKKKSSYTPRTTELLYFFGS